MMIAKTPLQHDFILDLAFKRSKRMRMARYWHAWACMLATQCYQCKVETRYPLPPPKWAVIF